MMWIMKYPGDPPYYLELLNKETFDKRFPDRVITLRDLSTGEILSQEPLEHIICDRCNADCEDVIYLLDNRRGYCKDCGKDLMKHCEPYTPTSN